MEYINLPNMKHHIVDRLGRGNNVSYWNEILRVRTSPNGVFGFKSFVPNFTFLGNNCEELLPYIYSDHVIYLTRDDRIAQAVSYARAHQTSSWFADVREASPPEYNFNVIAAAERLIAMQDADWGRLFNETGVLPLRVSYESFCSDSSAVISQVANFIGVEIDVEAQIWIPDIERQSDDLSLEWIERYNSEKDARAKEGATADYAGHIC